MHERTDLGRLQKKESDMTGDAFNARHSDLSVCHQRVWGNLARNGASRATIEALANDANTKGAGNDDKYGKGPAGPLQWREAVQEYGDDDQSCANDRQIRTHSSEAEFPIQIRNDGGNR